MHHATDNESSPLESDILLTKVNAVYQEIASIYGQMEKEVTAATPAGVEQRISLLHRLLADAQTLDEDISKCLINLPTFSESTGRLLLIRAEMLKKLHGANRSILNKAQNVKTMLHHEITSMHKNRNALQGYRPPDTGRGHIVRESY